MKEADRSKQSRTVVKKKNSSKEKKRRRVVESDCESSDHSSETSRQKADKHDTPSAVYKGAYSETKEFETEKRASSGLDVFEFDEYDGFDDIKSTKFANSRKHRWSSYRQSGDQMESGNGGKSRLEIEDDDFDLPLSAFTNKYRSFSNQPIRLQHDGEGQTSKSPKPMAEKTTKKSNSKVESAKIKPIENVKKDKEITVNNGGTEKQILREKIKNMLLDAGWSIGYRPRKNKNYLDAIYTNPSGTAYWSIIKAYETLEKGDFSHFTPLRVEILGKLARQTQKKTEIEFKTKRNNNDGRKSRCTLLVRDSNKILGNKDSGKRTILGWLIDSGVIHMREKVEYMNNRRTRVLKKGWITREGIQCGCCTEILTVFEFEEHSGSKLCNPFANMFVSESGKSLIQCQIDAWNKQGEMELNGFYTVDVDGDDPNDDTCGVCGDGGDLICCDGCPSAFHQTCLDIQMLPEGDWLCPNCSCKYCETAAVEESLVTCRLCYKKYHESCRSEPNSSNLYFCGDKCHEVYDLLQKVVGVKQELDGGFSWTLIHRSGAESLTDGQVVCNSMVAVAMSVMDECFMPFTDTKSGTNLIRNVVFNCGSNLSRINYSGFYTAVLERGDEVVSAASVRLHGTQLAEMPFIGTRHIYRRQGMCSRLLSAIESALSGVHVEKLMIPAVAEHMKTWTDVFGFRSLEESHKQQLKSLNMLVFPGTDMLQKPLNAIPPPLHLGNKTTDVDDGSGCGLFKKSDTDSGAQGKESESDSDSKANEIDVCNGNGNVTNPLLTHVHHLSHDSIQISNKESVDVQTQDAIKETLPINPPVKDESRCVQLSGMGESDSIRSHSDSKAVENENGNGTNPFPTIQLSNKESFSSVDVLTQGNK
ncbi:hypothetical protein LXL04_039100 [Taraxacum kok-saghyz]